MRRWFTWRGDDTHLSDRWLKEQARKGDRVEFHGPPIRFPVNKPADESAWWNRDLLKRRA